VVFRFALTILLWLSALPNAALSNETGVNVPRDNLLQAKALLLPAVLEDGNWKLEVNRAYNRGMNPLLSANDLQERVYQLVKNGRAYQITVSNHGSRVAIQGDRLMGGPRAKTTDSRLEYDLSEGTFAGGRFVIWSEKTGLQAELTIYGSGVPIILSERGALTKVP
jgi:hypothetical protein